MHRQSSSIRRIAKKNPLLASLNSRSAPLPSILVPTGTQAIRTFSTYSFQAETSKLLDIVAKSLYTDKEVFVRELISNASDALEKLRYLETTNKLTSKSDPDLELQIKVSVDAEKKIFIIEDTGIGMTEEELIKNLGTIAKSGSKEFVKNMGGENSGIIGQFGVGFYSVFVVANKVEVFSKHASSDVGFKWESEGTGEFKVEKVEGETVNRGTKIVLHLKEDAFDFASVETVKSAATKFSQFVEFPLKMVERKEVEAVAAADSPAAAPTAPEITEKEVRLNTQLPVWLNPSATAEQHEQFYRYLKNTSYGEPMYTLSFHTDAPLSIKSVFYVPEDAPDLWQPNPHSGVSLHSKRVLVNKHADTIIPQHFNWLVGLIDCDDIPLNVSRETVQGSALMKKLSSAVIRRFLRFLYDESNKDPKKFNTFYAKYKAFLKVALLEDVKSNEGLLKEPLTKLLRFAHVKGGEDLITLKDFADNLKAPDQDASMPQKIYYISAKSKEAALQSPYLELLPSDADCLVLTDEVDEFVMNVVQEWKGKPLVDLTSEASSMKGRSKTTSGKEDVLSLSVDAKKAFETQIMASEIFKHKVEKIKFTSNLSKSHCIVTSQISAQMRKMMRNMMQGNPNSTAPNDFLSGIPVTLELNENSPVIRKLVTELAVEQPKQTELVMKQLFETACVAAGLIDDPKILLSNLNSVIEFMVLGKEGLQRDVKEPEVEVDAQQ
jgi:TNF receptor-associated protein 1